MFKESKILVDEIEDADYLLLVDLSNLAYRSLYGYPLMEFNGMPVQHIFGTIQQIANFLMFKSKKIALIFCEDGSSYWRKEISASYKKSRTDKAHKGVLFMPSVIPFDLSDFDPVPDVARVTKFIPHAFHFKSDKDEADDVIAHLVKKYYDKKCVIFSSDSDLWQLSEEGRVVVWNGLSKCFIKKQHLIEKFKLNSWEKIAIYKAIFGDTGDDVDPCVPYLRKANILKALNSFEEGYGIIEFFKFLQIAGLSKSESKVFYHKDKAIRNYTLVKLDGVLHSKLLRAHNSKNTIKKLKKLNAKYHVNIEPSTLRVFVNS